MKKSLVQIVTADGHDFGQVSSPDDLMDAQDFAHEHILDVTHDFINSEIAAVIAGCGYTLGDGNSRTLTIEKPGRIYTPDASYELLADTELTVATADPDNPRIDLVIGKIEDEVSAETDLIPFVRLRTDDEFADEVPPYPPGNLLEPTQKHWRVTPQIKAGTPSDTPVPPTVDSNEIPLYSITVPAGSVAVHASEVLDLRVTIPSLGQQKQSLIALQQEIATLGGRTDDLGDIGGRYLNPPVPGHNTTLLEILSTLFNKVSPSRDLPDIRYDRPKVALTDPDSSKIVATGNVVSTVPVVEIPVGGRVNFGDAEVAILPQNFADQTVNPRFATVGGVTATHERRDVAITLAGVTQGESDGGLTFVANGAEISPAKQTPACAARDDRYIEIFGGRNASGAVLSDWKTYDTENDTITAQTLTGAVLPAADNALMVPYGDGINMLLIAATQAGSTSPGCYRINMDTKVVTAISGTTPQGYNFAGDLLTSGKIVVASVNNSGSTSTYEYDTPTHTFTTLATTGSIPPWPTINPVAGCLYAENQLVLFQPPGPGVAAGTFIFDRTTLQWTKLTISLPFDPASTGLTYHRFRMANVGGVPTLIGGRPSYTSGYDVDGRVWQLKGPTTTAFQNNTLQWTGSDVTALVGMFAMGFCSLIGAGGLAIGRGSIFGGANKFGVFSGAILSSRSAGLIAVSFNGVDGVSIADSSSFVTFEIPAYTAGGALAAYLVSLQGQYTSSNVKFEASYDDGDHWHVVDPDRTFTISDSDTPAHLRRRITLYNSKSNPPIITGLTEALDQTGGVIEDRLLVRFDVPAGGAKALYIDADGVVTISATIEPSTPQKAIILKFTPNGSSAPTLKNYINRRRPHVRYSGTKTSPVSNSLKFNNDLAVPVRFANAYVKTVSTGVLYKVDEPTVDFDADAVAMTGITNTGDVWYIELEG